MHISLIKECLTDFVFNYLRKIYEILRTVVGLQLQLEQSLKNE